jgi:hypothetical protein
MHNIIIDLFQISLSETIREKIRQSFMIYHMQLYQWESNYR